MVPFATHPTVISAGATAISSGVSVGAAVALGESVGEVDAVVAHPERSAARPRTDAVTRRRFRML
ncbi:hypothetical protein GCM10009860_21680 [Microbacterium mitrae]